MKSDPDWENLVIFSAFNLFTGGTREKDPETDPDLV